MHLYHFYALSKGHLLSIFTFTIYVALYWLGVIFIVWSTCWMGTETSPICVFVKLFWLLSILSQSRLETIFQPTMVNLLLHCSLMKNYQSIFLLNGHSLHEVSYLLSNQKRHGRNKLSDPSENYDNCYQCGDGGELLLCDECPKSFHIGEPLILKLISYLLWFSLLKRGLDISKLLPVIVVYNLFTVVCLGYLERMILYTKCKWNYT